MPTKLGRLEMEIILFEILPRLRYFIVEPFMIMKDYMCWILVFLVSLKNKNGSFFTKLFDLMKN